MENNEQNLNGVILLASLCAGVASGIAYLVGVFKGMEEQKKLYEYDIDITYHQGMEDQKKLDEYDKDIAYHQGKIDGYFDSMNIHKMNIDKLVEDCSDELSEEN